MRKLGDTELSLLGTDITEDLLMAHLCASPDTALLQSLGLVDREHRVTQSGWKVLSAYPFFGEGKGGRKHYPSLIFAFLLSLSRFLPSPVYDSPFFRKEGFLKLFPSFERAMISHAAYYITSAMEKHGLFCGDGLLQRGRAEQFMSLSILDRLSYVTAFLIDQKPEATKKALMLILLIDGLERKNLARIEKAVKAYSSITPDWTLLEKLGIIYEENGLVYASVIEECESEDDIFTLSSDYTVTYSGTYDRDIYLIADPVTESGNTVQWQITRTSIKRAFDMDITYDEITGILEEYSSYPIPPSISDQIKSWEREYGLVRIVRGTVVIVEERFSSLFSLPEVEKHIIEKLGNHSYLMDSGNSAEWRYALYSYGVNMLPSPKGPEFAELSPRSKFYCMCYPLPDFPALPQRREIPFDEKTYNKLLKEARDEWERLLVSSHLVFSKNGMSAYTFTDGLEYSAKRTLIQNAIRDEKALVIRGTDDTYHFVIPERLEGDMLTTDSGDVAVSKIWKVTAVMKAALRMTETEKTL